MLLKTKIIKMLLSKNTGLNYDLDLLNFNMFAMVNAAFKLITLKIKLHNVKT